MRSPLRFAATFSLFALLLFTQDCISDNSSKAVLVLLPGQPGAPATVDFLLGLRRTLFSNPDLSVDVYSEHLNVQQFPYPEYESKLIEWLRTKYSKLEFSAIVTATGDGFRFAEKWRDVLWPETPVVFSVVDQTGRNKFPPNFTGINFPMDYLRTVNAALQLQPKTRYLALISGASNVDLLNREYVLEQLVPLKNRIEIIEIYGLPVSEIEKRLSQLPENTIVLCSSYIVDGAGKILFGPELLARFIAASNRPMYEVNELSLGLGIVGGKLVDYEEAGVEAGQIVLRILTGESASNIPVQTTKTPHLIFDWRQLRRWGIDESRLPAGSIVKFRAASFWEIYKWHISGAVALIILQSMLIATLLTERSRRQAAQESERKTTELSYSVLNSVQEQVGILNKEGQVVAVNDSWACFKPETEKTMPMGTAVGKNCLEECIRASEYDENAAKAMNGIQSVLKGIQNHFSMEYIYHSEGEQNWVEMSVQSLKTKEGGAVISFANITERRIAEIEAHERRQEIFHVSRAAAMGELASSLAHELNQPLTAILSNVQAASRYLASEPPNLKEVKEILHDVVSDDVRAAEIIHRIRALLKKEEINFALVDLNEVVNNVVRLTRNEALMRRVNLRTDLTEGLPLVLGDTIQLQQVVLNLVMNALDSTSQQDYTERLVEASTKFDGPEVKLRVFDLGKGISPEQFSQIFEPFYTTKKEGLGIGLSICNSIVKAHGGRIWVESKPGKGAAFYCSFPKADITDASQTV